MSKDNYDNGFVNFVLTLVILGGVYQCAKETWAKVEPQVTGFFNGVGIVLSSYLFPFVVASLTTGFILNQLCKLPREWGGSPIDFRFSATGISLIAAPILLYFGIPKAEATWMISMWAGILFGGPLHFWFLAKKAIPKEERRLKKAATEPLEEKLEALQGDLSCEENKNYGLSSQLRELQAEVEKLQRRDSFLSKKEKDDSGEKSSNILDSNDDFWQGSD